MNDISASDHHGICSLENAYKTIWTSPFVFHSGGGMGGIESILLISDDLQKMMIMLAYFYLNKYQTNDQIYLYL